MVSTPARSLLLFRRGFRPPLPRPVALTGVRDYPWGLITLARALCAQLLVLSLGRMPAEGPVLPRSAVPDCRQTRTRFRATGIAPAVNLRSRSGPGLSRALWARGPGHASLSMARTLRGGLLTCARFA